MRVQYVAPEAELQASPDRARTLAAFFDAFGPAPAWHDLPAWPPDVFALTNLVLDHTQSYRFVVAPPPAGRWPPMPMWNEQVATAARAWSASADDQDAPLPELVERCWRIVSRARDLPLAKIQTGEAWEVCEALLNLHAIADESCAWLSAPATPSPCPDCEARAWKLLDDSGSLSRISPTRIRVVPKGRFTNRGITIRSLSRYLALCYESVDLRWNRVGPDAGVAASLAGRQDYNLLLLPWPHTVRASDFRRVPTPLGNMDEEHFGFFEFMPEAPLDMGFIRSLLRQARAEMGGIDAVILPEAALETDDIDSLEDVLGDAGVTVLIAGVRTRRIEGVFGRNYLHLGVHIAGGWKRLEQDKHHRWRWTEGKFINITSDVRSIRRSCGGRRSTFAPEPSTRSTSAVA